MSALTGVPCTPREVWCAPPSHSTRRARQRVPCIYLSMYIAVSPHFFRFVRVHSSSGSSLLTTGYILLITGCVVLATWCILLTTGYTLLITGCVVLATRVCRTRHPGISYSSPGVSYLPSGISYSSPGISYSSAGVSYSSPVYILLAIGYISISPTTGYTSLTTGYISLPAGYVSPTNGYVSTHQRVYVTHHLVCLFFTTGYIPRSPPRIVISLATRYILLAFGYVVTHKLGISDLSPGVSYSQ